MTKYTLIPIAHGTEEMEVVIVVDVLRRAGIMVKVAGDNEIVTCSRGVKILPDELIDNLDLNAEYDAVILPGGAKGADNLMKNSHLLEIIRRQKQRGAIIAAICAGPTILSENAIIKPGTNITSHPSVKNQFDKYNYIEQNLVYDDCVLTSRGAGTAFEFSLYLVELLVDKETVKKIKNDIVLR